MPRGHAKHARPHTHAPRRIVKVATGVCTRRGVATAAVVNRMCYAAGGDGMAIIPVNDPYSLAQQIKSSGGCCVLQ